MKNCEEFDFISEQQSNVHETIFNVPDFELNLKNDIIDDTFTNIMHFHDSYEIIFFVKSQNQIFIKDIAYSTENNEIMIIPPREVHTIKYNKGTVYQRYVLYFSKKFILRALLGLDCENILNYFDSLKYKKTKLNASNINKISYLLFAINKCTKKQNSNCSADKILIKTYLTTLIVEIYDIFKSHNVDYALTGPGQIVQNIIKFIDEYYKKNLTLGNIVNDFYVNKYYICHVFKKIAGVSIIEYLQFRRIIEAQKMLIDTNMEILDICFECGFNNLQHFYRVFKKISNSSPSHYRKGEQKRSLEKTES